MRGLVLLSTALMVEDYKSVSELPYKGPEEFCCFPGASRVSAWDEQKPGNQSAEYLKRTASKGGREAQSQCCISCEKNEVTHRQDADQPRTPLAKSVPRSVSPFHSLSRGCSDPRTMSVAPSTVLAKHST